MVLLADGRVKRDGFTLMELVIAIAILGILAVTIGPRLLRYLFVASETKAKNEMLVMKQSILEYYGETRQYPKALIDLMRKPSGVTNWHGPYLEETSVKIEGNNIIDPWDQPYQYRVTSGGKNRFDLYSLGDKDNPQKIDVHEIR